MPCSKIQNTLLVPAFLVLVTVTVLIGCAQKQSFDGLASDGAAMEPAAPPPARVAATPALAQAQEAQTPAQGQGDQLEQVSAPDRKLIRNAYVTLEVSSAETATAEIRALVEAAGGYVGNESQSEDGYGAKRASLTCRVPADRLDELLEQTQGQGTVESLQISAQDITEQYFDLEIRLGTQQQLETRLLELLERSSNELQDLLEIERELARVRGQIDQMEGRRRFWDHQVAMATLQIELHEPRPAIAGSEGGVLRTLGNAFRDAGNNFVDALAFVISSIGALLPVAAAFALLVWLLLRWRRRAKGATR